MARSGLLIKNTIKSFYLGKKLRDMYQRRGFTKKAAEKAFDIYYGENSKLDKNKIVNDMLQEARKYSFGFDEYHMYHFENMLFEDRRTYVSDRERITYCERMNNMKNMIIFDDKGLTYQTYKQFYNRDLLEIFNEKDFDRFSHFIKKHVNFIVKPFDGACGVGIKIINSKGKDEKSIFNGLLKEYSRGLVVEELIKQKQEMSMLHPQSVNTLRVPTIKYPDHVDIIHPILRIGRGNAVVDNGGSGGICCGIDVSTGKTFSAVDEYGNSYTSHPDTGIELIGYQIPLWNEAKNLVKELAEILPDNHYTGWDLALTDNGWILQEANDRGTFILFQITSDRGFRAEVEKIIDKLGV